MSAPARPSRPGRRTRGSPSADPADVPDPATPATATGGPVSSGAPAGARPVPRRRVAVLAEVALLPVVVSYVAVVVLALLLTGVAAAPVGTEAGLGHAAAVGVPLWLAAHLVPLHLQGVSVSAWPLLPAIGIVVGVAAAARRGSRRLGGRRTGGDVTVVAATGVAHAACGVLAAALLAPETVVDAAPAGAGLRCGLLAAIAAAAGTLGPTLRDAIRRDGPSWLRRGLTAGLLATALLVAAGTVLVLAAVLVHTTEVAAVSERLAPAAGSAFGLALLSLGYLPNAVVGGIGWLLGPGVGLGAATAAPTAVVAGAPAPLPLAAVLPAAPPASWAGLAFAVPLAVGSLVGWLVAPLPGGAPRLKALGSAAGVVAVLLAVLALLGGGRLGQGPFDPLTLRPGLLLLVGFGWIAVPGAVVALVAVPLDRRPPTPRSARSDGDPQDDPRGDPGGSPDDDPADDGWGPPALVDEPRGTAADGGTGADGGTAAHGGPAARAGAREPTRPG